MPATAEVHVDVVPDVSKLARVARIIAEHLTAMADELESQ